MRALLVVASLMLTPILGCAPSGPPPSAASPILDQGLPAFRRPTVNGDRVSTKEGRVTVVKFFAKYCEPCKKTLPEAQRLSRRHPDVLFVGVAEDEFQADVQEMITQFGLTFPIVHDRGNVLAGRFRVDELPITFVADSGGTVRWVGDGTRDGGLEAAIEWAKAPPP